VLKAVEEISRRSIATSYHILFFATLAFLAIFHIPLLWVRENAIGLFDIMVIGGYVLLIVAISVGQHIELGDIWKEYLLIALFYSGYLFFSYLLNFNRTAQPFLIIIKYIENTFFLLLLVFHFETKGESLERTVKIVHFLLVILVLYQLYHYFTGTPVVSFDKPWLRIGLPFMPGTSSNPAGFILAISVILHISVFIKIEKKKLIPLITLLLTLVALIFTISRTNVFGLLIVLLAYSFTNIFKDKRAIIIGSLIVVATFIIFSIVSRSDFARTGKINTFIQLLRNPSRIFQEGSFMIRYTGAWPEAYRQWTENIVTMIFGKGIGYMSVVDGTFLRLLANQGVIGLLFFFYIWFGFFLLRFGRHKWLRTTLLFVFINGITGDTLIVSFRTIQIYIVQILTLVYSLDYLEKKKVEGYA